LKRIIQDGEITIGAKSEDSTEKMEILPSQFYGALIGVVITAIITVFLLQGQTANKAV
jgi:hypothetical protein